MKSSKIEEEIESIRCGMKLLGCPMPRCLDDVSPRFRRWLSTRFPSIPNIHLLGLIVPLIDFRIRINEVNFMNLYCGASIISMSEGEDPPYIAAVEHSRLIIGDPYTADRILISLLHERFYEETYMTSQCEIEAWEEGDEPDYAFKIPSSIYSGFLEIKTNPEVLVEAFCRGYSGTGMLERRVQSLAFLKSLTAGTDVMTPSFTTKFLSMPEEIASIRQLFTFFGAFYPPEPPSRDYFYDYLVSECSLLAVHADFLNWIVPSEGFCIASMRVFSRKESVSWTTHLQNAGFDGIIFMADRFSAYSIGLRSNYDSKKLEAAYINSQSVEDLKHAKWHPDVQSLIYNCATGDSDALDFFATHMGGYEETDELWHAFQTTISS